MEIKQIAVRITAFFVILVGIFAVKLGMDIVAQAVAYPPASLFRVSHFLSGAIVIVTGMLCMSTNLLTLITLGFDRHVYVLGIIYGVSAIAIYTLAELFSLGQTEPTLVELLTNAVNCAVVAWTVTLLLDERKTGKMIDTLLMKLHLPTNRRPNLASLRIRTTDTVDESNK